jgi:hypothetical protein
MAREEEGFFDDLARGLADGSLTRGKALRLMGAALLGGTLGSLGIGEAGAAPPGCKRAGKHCTRNDQCCGSLVCLSGTCQTPTTTTSTSTTSTSTTTPTTSTSTSTTSTSTTTCSGLPNGASCTANTQCCSGNCSNGFCCESGRVGLSNGTCARSCTTPEECVAAGCAPNTTGCESDSGTNARYCRSSLGFSRCTSTADCLTGQFCAREAFFEQGFCVAVC